MHITVRVALVLRRSTELFVIKKEDEFRFAESFNSDIVAPILIGAESDHDFPDISSYKNYVKPTPAPASSTSTSAPASTTSTADGGTEK